MGIESWCMELGGLYPVKWCHVPTVSPSETSSSVILFDFICVGAGVGAIAQWYSIFTC